MAFIVTIDGPAGAGKSTIALRLAKRLSLFLLETGGLYRAIGVAFKSAGISDTDSQLREFLSDIKISYNWDGCESKIFLNGKEITEKLYEPGIGLLASNLSKKKIVRDYLLDFQRKLGEDHDLITEGRDMGTVVFPNATVKFFLDAAPKERARRRYSQLKEKGSNVTFDDVYNEILQRDRQDRERAIAPLRPADDAILVDSTDLSIEEVVSLMEEKIKEKVDRLK